MYPLGEAAAGISNLAFGLIGVWMAHSLYRTTRKRWQAVLAWVFIFFVWTFGAMLIRLILPGISDVRASMCIGFTGIFVYLYLFQSISIPQRVFTYFMVDTWMLLPVLFSRTISMFLAERVPIATDTTFLILYSVVMTAFSLAFHLKAKAFILAALPVFRNHLIGLAAFAAICYVTIMLLFDPWDSWGPLNIWEVLARFAIVALAGSGYFLSFRTLKLIREQDLAAASAKQLETQLAFSEQHYADLVERIEQTKRYHHDLRHHIRALSILCSEKNWGEVSKYISEMSHELPKGLPKEYCSMPQLNAMLGHYALQCGKEGIPFHCQMRLPADLTIEPLHLCIIFGNALENALEGCKSASAPYISLKTGGNKNTIAIQVENPFAGSLVTDNEGELISTKSEPGHGSGLSSIRETARRYGGWCGITKENGIFLLHIMLKV